jgi:hypothetical protein
MATALRVMPLRERKLRTRSPSDIKNGLRKGSSEPPTSTNAVDESDTDNSKNTGLAKVRHSIQGKTLEFKHPQNMHFTAYSSASKIVHLYRLLPESPSVLMQTRQNF